MDDPNVTTAAGLAELQRQLDELEGDGRREIADRIKTAREWGDLKENSEYHDAKNEQAHLETKIARLRDRIANATVVETDAAEDGTVALGRTVVVRDESGADQTWAIVSSHEASPPQGRLSVDSPVARALAGHRAGDAVTVALPRGERVLTIVRVG